MTNCYAYEGTHYLRGRHYDGCEDPPPLFAGTFLSDDDHNHLANLRTTRDLHTLCEWLITPRRIVLGMKEPSIENWRAAMNTIWVLPDPEQTEPLLWEGDQG